MNGTPLSLRLIPIVLLFLAGNALAALGFLDDLRLSGDLDGDGQNELVLLLWDDPGGSGTFVYLNVIRKDEQGNPQAQFALVGDRVQVMDARIENGLLLLEVIQPGEQEAPCCGSQKVLRRWRMEAGKLVEEQAEVEGKVSVEDLEGKRWLLESFGDAEVSAGQEITIEVKNGQVIGSGGCNRYFASVSDVQEPGRAIKIGPVGSTRKACPAPVMDVEQRYLKALRHVTGFSIAGRELVLTWNDGDSYGVLRFREIPPAE